MSTTVILKESGAKIMLVTENVLFPDLLNLFERALVAAGYVFNGRLELVEIPEDE